jgi:outer membrane protein
VLKQINDGAQPIITTIMKERGASIAIPEGATLQHSASIDVTTDVIARLDKALPRVSSTVPAAAAAPATK